MPRFGGQHRYEGYFHHGNEKAKEIHPEVQERSGTTCARRAQACASVARDLGLWESVLTRWVRQAKVDSGKGQSVELKTAEREELARLRRENQVLRMEREILKNYRARGRLLLEMKPRADSLCSPRRSGRTLIGAVEPVKKHGPGVAADLRVVTPVW